MQNIDVYSLVMIMTHFIIITHKLFSFHRKHQIHPLFVELHIHREKQTEDNSFHCL